MRGGIHKKGNYYYAVVYDGIDPGTGRKRRSWIPAGTRRSDAEKILAEEIKRRHDGVPVPTEKLTFGQYLTDRWLPIQKSRVRHSTYDSYRRNIELHVLPALGRRPIERLTPDDIDVFYATLLLAVQNAADFKDLGVATSSVNFFRSLGGSFGVSIFGVLFATLLDDKLAALLPPGALSSAGLSPEALTGTPEQIQALPPDILLPVTQAMADSITAIFLCTVPLLAIGVAIAIVVPELPLKDTAHIGSTLEGAEITVAEMAGGEAAVDELTDNETVPIDVDGAAR